MANPSKTLGILGILGAVCVVYGCSTTHVPFDIGGSKADGTVVMGVTVSEFDEVDWEGANHTALERCRAWGFVGARAFSGVRERCVVAGGWSGCARKELFRTYQCLD